MIYLLFLASLAISIAYAFVIMQYLDGWNETPIKSDLVKNPKSSVSILIAVYNEEQRVKACIDSILANSYPENLFELLIIDNGSTDSTVDIVNAISHPSLRLLSEPRGYKKEALEKGLAEAKGEWIIMTDGDCTMGKEWISSMVEPRESENAEMVMGPVEIRKYNNLLTRFQAFDMLAMMGITSGGIRKSSTYLSNGANMAFAKSVYNALGEIPRKDIPSGDDVFLLHEYIRNGGKKVFYNKSKYAIVKTEAQNTWKNLVNQRIRWSSKSMSYVNNKDRYIAMFIFLYCLSILFNIVISPFTGGVSFFFAAFQLFIKAVIDYAFILQINIFFKKKHLMKYFIPSFFVHYSYILFAGLSGIFRIGYKWRGKKV